ncbi:MAG: hypothetical protein HN353_11085 [Bdellovibrionales bacterium]|nr:hypothetical protein [Bdellovibrionales bacterium]MBT3525188.1 hypothetical protein [Bdellovibrionales bacterium]MBT7670431.1 hypothetical protein [Bdellovibrionales bacterium]
MSSEREFLHDISNKIGIIDAHIKRVGKGLNDESQKEKIAERVEKIEGKVREIIDLIVERKKELV